MWTPNHLHIKNLFSHADTSFDFTKGECFVLTGQNLDDPSQASNGSGKSAFIEGIFLALTGDLLRSNILTIDAIRDGQEEMTLELCLVHSTGEVLTIQRDFFANSKSSKVRVFVNENLQSDLISVPNSNKYILEKLGITKQDICNYFIISTDSYQPFLSSSDTVKKTTIARFSNANSIDGIDKLIKAACVTMKTEISTFEREVSLNTGRIEVLKEQITNANRVVDFSSIDRSIERFVDNISVAEESIKQAKLIEEALIADGIATKAKSDLVAIPDPNAKDDFLARSLELNKLLGITRDDKNKFLSYISRQEAIVKGGINCPECDHEFTLGAKITPKAAAANIATSKVEIEAIDKDATKIKAELADITKELASIDQKNQALTREKSNYTSQLNAIKYKIQNARRDVAEGKNSIESYLSQIKSLEQSKTKVTSTVIDVDAINGQIEVAQETIRATKRSIRTIESKHEQHFMWLTHFKSFVTHLANQSIKSIEGFTNSFLSKLNTNLEIEMSGYSKTGQGKIRDKMSISVRRDGGTATKLGRFSSGEKTRIEIANILALQRLINLNSDAGGLDLLILDEIVSSSDGEGLQSILKMLSMINKTIAVVSHVGTDRTFDNLVTVTKQNQVSTIKKSEIC